MDPALEGPAALPEFDTSAAEKTRSIAVETLWAVICSVLCALRIYTRIFLIRRFTLEDWAIALGWMLFISFSVFHMLILSVSAGIEQWNLRTEDVSKVYFYMYMASFFNIATLVTVKTAILLQYLEIFTPKRLNPVIYWSCHVLIWTNITFYLTLLMMSIFRCHPIPKAWNAQITEGSCFISVSLLSVIVNSISIVTDFVILVLPQISIWRMQMANMTKTTVSIVFLVAVFALASSVVRLIYFFPLIRNPNDTYHWYTMGAWLILEAVSAFAVACVPVLPRFFKGMREKLKLRRSSSDATITVQ